MPDPASTTISVPRLALGEGIAGFEAAVQRARSEEWANRLFDRDVTLWSSDQRVGATIAERLGWLDAPEHFANQTAALEGFGDAVVDQGYTTAVVAGMGGSSLAPDVLHRTFGSQEGYLALRILDSTDPEYVAAIFDDLDPLQTLILIASKSGTTTEPNAFLAEAWARAQAALDVRRHHTYEQPGGFIAAISDPGRSIDAIPHHDDFREVFLNPPNIGGRYSALTYVGLVPASLIGLDLDALLASGLAMLGACREPDPTANPGLSLGLAIGTLARNGRDKLTFLTDAAIASFGAWIEQLIAESTGKHGVGIVPVDLEPLGAVDAYGPDRAFVRIAFNGRATTHEDAAQDRLADALEAAGHPVIRIELSDPIDLGAEAVRWEVATAFAGAVLGIDPFDQPNVEEAKQLTRDLLDQPGTRRGRLHAAARAGRQRRRTDPPRRRRAPADLRRWRRRRRAGPPPRAAAAERLPVPPGVHCADARSRRGDGRDPVAPARPDRAGDDGRLWPTLPAFDRPAPQGRRADRLVHPADGGPPGRPADPGLAVHLRAADRRAGGRRLRGHRVA